MVCTNGLRAGGTLLRTNNATVVAIEASASATYVWEGKPYCLTMAGIYEAWNMAVLRVGSLLLPCPIIVILTVCILVMLRARHRPERFLRSTSVEQPQTTAMVLAVATSCVVLRVPYAIFWYLSSNSKKWGTILHAEY